MTGSTIYYIGESQQRPEYIGFNLVSIYEEDLFLNLHGATVIVDLAGESQDAFLRRLHAQPHGWSTQVFVTAESKYSPFLSDGEFDISSYKPHADKLALLPERPRDRLLAYLWLNKNRRLNAKRDTSDKSLYSFPLLQAYHNEEKTPFKYLHQLEKNSFLEEVAVTDRVRHCKFCDSGYLNYVDTCPSCSSIDISKFDALHCFTCGHVDDASEFVKSSYMSCPKCSTKLKHIGVDYDRPLEMLSCNDCSSEFAEAEVVASCLSCDTKTKPGNLLVRSYKELKLGEDAQKYLLDGESGFVAEVNLTTSVEPRVFEALIEWKNKLALRHGHKALLMGIKLVNVEQFTKSEGEVAFIEFMSKFSEVLESMFRTTDVCCQYQQDLVMVLLPHFELENISDATSLQFDVTNLAINSQTKTDNFGETNLSIIEQRLSDFAELIDLPYLAMTVKHWSLPEQQLLDASQWLNGKAGELDA